jgi:hypothetical protein
MSKNSITGVMLALGIAAFVPASSNAMVVTTAGLQSALSMPSIVENVVVRRTTTVRRGGTVVRRSTVVRGPVGVVRPYRAWVRRPYYGTIIGGVALGTIIAATAVPAAPGPNMCWYWANSAKTRGYWDYCQ